MAQQSNFSTLCRGHLLPKEITNEEEMVKFMEAVDPVSYTHLQIVYLEYREIAT